MGWGFVVELGMPELLDVHAVPETKPLNTDFGVYTGL
jgi:hypothetical protein